MTIEELFEELRQLPGSVATAHVTFVAKLRDATEQVRDYAFSVTRVHYQQGVVVLDIEQTAAAWGPESKAPSAMAVLERRAYQRARRQLAKARRGGTVLPHRTKPDPC
jgi:hypothetical protein